MKTYQKFLLVITMLCAAIMAEAATHTITTTNGNISVQGSNYVADMYEVWNINTGTDKPIIFNYQLDLETVSVVDGVYIYNVNADGSQSNCIFSGWGACSGTVSTTLLTGRARVVFETFEGNLGTYDGFSLNFAVDSSVTISDNLYISGKVGIGTGSPQEKLHVNGAICGNVGSARALKVKTTYGYIDLGPRGTQSADINTDRTKFLFNKPIWITEGLLSSYYNKDLLLQTEGTTRMTINKTNGFVGIGTTTPSATLDINGTLKSDSVIISGNLNAGGSLYVNNDLFVTGTQHFNIGYWNDSCLYIGSNAMHSNISAWDATYLQWKGHSLIMGSPIGKYAYNRVELKAGGYSGQALQTEFEMFQTKADLSYESRIKLHSNGYSYFNGGNVGIGTVTPQYKLDVLGTVRAREIIVDLNGTSGADFVFSPGYNLPSLQEISTFVNENRHLPEIPSEAEMQTKGVSVHELQIKLLQKVEELTLYLIEQDKTIKALNAKIEQLEKK